MEIERYEGQYREALRHWFHLREMDERYLDEIPDHGFIALEKTSSGMRPIAAAFLRRLEASHYALIDSMITNPLMPGYLRNHALDVLTERLIQKAKELGLKAIMALSDDSQIIERSLRHGFEVRSHQLVSFNLDFVGGIE